MRLLPWPFESLPFAFHLCLLPVGLLPFALSLVMMHPSLPHCLLHLGIVAQQAVSDAPRNARKHFHVLLVSAGLRATLQLAIISPYTAIRSSCLLIEKPCPGTCMPLTCVLVHVPLTGYMLSAHLPALLRIILEASPPAQHFATATWRLRICVSGSSV